MKIAPYFFSVVTLAGSMSEAAENISYQKLVELAQGDSTTKEILGKKVQIDIVGKGDLGYFVKKSDNTTFVCATGNKLLTSNKTAKGLIQGTIVKVQGWDGATIYHLNTCQFEKSETSPGVQPNSTIMKQIYEFRLGILEITGVGDHKKMSITTSTERGGSCQVDGLVTYATASRATFIATGDSSCTADLIISGDSITVKSKNCTSSFCGASGPGFDFTYTLKKQ